MPVKNESLQAKTLKKLSPNTIRNLPSPLKTEALNEIATEIKKNLLQRSRYNTYRMGELLDQKQFLPYFPMLKDREKRIEQDEIWKKICNELEWEFIPTI